MCFRGEFPGRRIQQATKIRVEGYLLFAICVSPPLPLLYSREGRGELLDSQLPKLPATRQIRRVGTRLQRCSAPPPKFPATCRIRRVGTRLQRCSGTTAPSPDSAKTF